MKEVNEVLEKGSGFFKPDSGASEVAKSPALKQDCPGSSLSEAVKHLGNEHKGKY